MKDTLLTDTIIKRIFDAVYLNYGFSFADIARRDKSMMLSEARAMACFVLHKYARLTYGQIGELIDRDRTSALYNAKTIKNLMTYDKEIKAKYNNIVIAIS